MTSVDWILLGLMLLSTVVGLVRGLVFEVLSLLGWVAAFFVAQWLAPLLGRHLLMQGLSDSVRYAAAFALTFVAAVMVAGLLAALLRKLLAAVGLRPVDRLLGGAFGALRGVVLLLAVAVVIDLTPLKRAAWWEASTAAPVLGVMLVGLKPALPESFSRFLN